MVKLNDAAKKMIEGKNFASIATVMPDGSPQVTTVWVDHEGDTVLVNTAEGRLKHKNLIKNPKVALSVYDMSNPYNQVVVRGRVVEITRSGADDHIDKMAKKYMGKDKYPYHNPKQKRVIVRIEPIRVSSPM